LEEIGELQNGICERYFDARCAMHKAKIKESFTEEQQLYKGKKNPGKLQEDKTRTDRS
jgi:hypothetical protein